MDYGTKYCHSSPSIDEDSLHEAIMAAIMDCAQQNDALLDTLKHHISLGMKEENHSDPTPVLMIRVAEIEKEYNQLLTDLAANISSDTFDDTRIRELMEEKRQLQQQIEQNEAGKQKQATFSSRISEISSILDASRNRSLAYDDQLVRQILECVVVESKDRIRVVFVGGMAVVQQVM